MKIIEFFKQLFCRHKWQQTSVDPVLKVADEGPLESWCAWMNDYKCPECGKEKTVGSGIHLGMVIDFETTKKLENGSN
jgi:hypothetical protein